MPKYIKLIIALALFIAVIVWVEYELSWLSVWHSWQQLSIRSLLALLILTFASYLLRAYRIYYLFAKPNHHFCDYLNIHLLHNALNNFLPMRLGEASFPLLMKRRFNTSFISSSGSLVWIRLLDLHWLVSCMLLILGIEFSVLFFVGLLVWIGLPLFIYLTPYQLIDLAPRFVSKQWSLIASHIPQQIGQLSVVYFQTALLWSFKLVALCIVLITFIDVSFMQALFGVIAADLSSVLPIHGVAGTGTYEAAMIAGMAPFINYSEDLLLAIINVHIYLLISTLISIPIAFLLPTTRSQN